MQRDDFAQRVRDAVDIVDIVSDQTRLQRRGKRLLGLCPFHKEKTPSFSVDPAQGLYYCFGCGAGGDALGFHMQVTGDDFRTTLEIMARRYGVEIPERGADPAPHRDFDEALEAAAEFFTEQLRRSKGARSYLERRRIEPELISSYGLGFAPDAWQTLHDALGSRFDSELLEKVGLLGRSEGGRVYDRFRNRLMFPIRATTGRIVGFGGRTLGDDRAKYINTAETPAFRKGTLLYGLDTARPKIREEGKVLLVEGYFDVLGAVASGIGWAVAGMGTALTTQQAKLLVRYADEVVLGYDGDRAGEEAARKSLHVLLPSGAVVRRARFPAGQDPDSLRLEEGTEAVREVVDSAPDAVLLEIERLPVEAAADPREAAVAAEPMAELLQTVPDQILRREYAKRAAGRLGVRDDLLLTVPRKHRRSDDEEEGGEPSVRRREVEPIEHQLLRLLLAGAQPEAPPVDACFWHADYRRLYRAWRHVSADEDRAGDLAAAMRADLSAGDERDDHARGALQLLALLTLERDDEEEDLADEELDAVDGLVVRLERRRLDRERERTRAAMDEAQRAGDSERLEELVLEHEALKRRRFRLET